MNDELLASIEREVLSWPSVSKEPDRSSVSVYRFGRRQIGHVHHDGVVDLPFPRAVQDDLISHGVAQPHRGGFRAVVSYYVRTPEDVLGAVELFRMNYDRAKVADERRKGREEQTSMRRHILSRPTWRPRRGRAQRLCPSPCFHPHSQRAHFLWWLPLVARCIMRSVFSD